MLQEQLIPLTPCKPLRLCWESELQCIHTGDSSTPRAALLTLPGIPTTHTHTQLTLVFLSDLAFSNAVDLALPAGQTDAVPCRQI